MKRQKELLCSGLDLAPLRLLGGFICIDTHIGCDGCSYCLNRRHPLLDRILNQNAHTNLERLGITTKDVADWLSALPAYHKAHVPIRIGHLTDWKYEIVETAEIVEAIPSDYPVVVMTRHPLTDPQQRLLEKHPNVLAHLSISPLCSELDHYRVDASQVISSTLTAPAGQVFFMLRPLIAGGEGVIIELLDQLLPESRIGFHSLSTGDIPGMENFNGIEDSVCIKMKTIASDKGLMVHSHFGCALRANLGIPFFKFLSGGDGMQCASCTNLPVCSIITFPDKETVKEELERLQIPAEHIEFSNFGISIRTQTPAARAEEVYLSELFNVNITLSTVGRSHQAGIYELDPTIPDRWERIGFYPVSRMKEVSNGLLELLGIEIG